MYHLPKVLTPYQYLYFQYRSDIDGVVRGVQKLVMGQNEEKPGCGGGNGRFVLSVGRVVQKHVATELRE